MDKEIYITLITKQLSGELSAAEQQQLDAWLSLTEANQKLYNQMEADWELSHAAKKTIEVDVDKDYETFMARLSEVKDTGHMTPEPAKVISLKSSNRRWLYLAASLALLVTAWFVFAPSQVAKQLVVQTTLDETRTIQLGDGTKVILNENSRLTYPEFFTEDARSVALQGEGYFVVAKNAEAPFKVNLKNTTVEVLGTEFNVNESKIGNEVLVHVDEGKVRFSANENKQQVELIADEGAVFNGGDQTVSKLNQYNKNATSWKTNSLIFEGNELSQVLSDIGVHFGITINLELEPLMDCSFSGYYPKPDVNAVLTNIASSYGMNLTQDRNGNYLLTGGNCKTD